MLHWYHKRCCLYLFSLELSDSSSFGGVFPYCILLHVDSASQSLDVVLVSINQLFAVESLNEYLSWSNTKLLYWGFINSKKLFWNVFELPFRFGNEVELFLSAETRNENFDGKPDKFQQFFMVRSSMISMSYLLSSRDCKCSQSALALAFNLSTSKWSILSGLRRSARIFFLRSRSVPRPFLRSKNVHY